MFDYTHNDRTDGLGVLAEITRLIKILDWALDTDRHRLVDSIQDRIKEMPLALSVRDAWRPAGQLTDEQPDEFEILLATGGPAVRIWGTLSHGCPWKIQLQNQDWGTPWQTVDISDEGNEALWRFSMYFDFAD